MESVVSAGKLSWKCKKCNKTFRKNPKKKQKGWHQWNKGLTKETDKRVAGYGRSGSQTKRSNPSKYAEISRQNRRKTAKLEGKVSPEEMQELYDKLGSHREVAKQLNVAQSAISLFMKRHNLKSKPKFDIKTYLKNASPEEKKRVYEKVSKSMKGNTNWRFSHQFPNKEEKKLIRYFRKWKLPFKYVGDGSFKIDGKCPDFVWKEKKTLIEFFGELWHEESDEPKRIEFFESRGWKCLVIWGKEVGFNLKMYKNYKWEKILYDKIIQWLLGLGK